MKQTKKGFTLVELLVVIAILAILASVSIVGYTSFIAKANLSNDQATISMINRNLQAEWLTEKPASAGEAFASLYSLGFSSEKLEPYSGGFHYVYDLSANQMYLFDKNDKLVYPENVNPAMSDLWAQYRESASDAVDGITNYIAMQPVTEYSASFEDVFSGNGSYKLDLNGYYLDREHQGATITVLNGAITPDSTGFTLGNDAIEFTVAQHPGNGRGNVTIENQIIDTANFNKGTISRSSGDSVVIKNCLIVGAPGASLCVYATSVTIENCTFTGFEGWSLQILSTESEQESVVIRNNTFINTMRGISFWVGCFENSIIEGNTFKLEKDSHSNAIQFAFDTNSQIKQPSDITGSVVIKNNNFDSCNAAIVVHNNVSWNIVEAVTDSQTTKVANVTDEQWEQIATWENALANYVTFENNTYGTMGSGEKLFADPDTPELSEKEAAQEVMKQLKELFQQEIK